MLVIESGTFYIDEFLHEASLWQWKGIDVGSLSDGIFLLGVFMVYTSASPASNELLELL